MKKQVYLPGILLLAIGSHSASRAQTNWFTPEVGRVLGQEISLDEPATAPPFRTVAYKLKNCRIVAGTVAYFDTIATYAQGRVVDAVTHRPLKAALIQVSYGCFGRAASCEIKTAVTDSAGFFRLGWVGCSGPAGGHRPLQVKAAGHQVISTQQVGFGGLAYLHIELAARK